MGTTSVIRTTADIRAKILEVWRQVEKKEISASEARLHIGLARVLLETLKVEIAAAHLARTDIPAVTVSPDPIQLGTSRRQQ
jgi:hypothetical protein